MDDTPKNDLSPGKDRAQEKETATHSPQPESREQMIERQDRERGEAMEYLGRKTEAEHLRHERKPSKPWKCRWKACAGARALWERGMMGVEEIAERFGVARTTVWRHRKEEGWEKKAVPVKTGDGGEDETPAHLAVDATVAVYEERYTREHKRLLDGFIIAVGQHLLRLEKGERIPTKEIGHLTRAFREIQRGRLIESDRAHQLGAGQQIQQGIQFNVPVDGGGGPNEPGLPLEVLEDLAAFFRVEEGGGGLDV